MKLFLAAYESAFSNKGITLPKETNLFLSFFYRKLTEKALKGLKELNHTGLVVIDSGAHSFFAMTGLSITNTRSEIESRAIPENFAEKIDAYFKQYISFLLEYKEYYSFFVELDLQEIIGQEKVLAWRTQLRDLGLLSKCITVHHSMNTEIDFQEQLLNSESKYVAVEGIRRDFPLLPYNYFIREAYEKKIKIHCFGFIKQKLLLKHPFYSVDSSSWKSPTLYGSFRVFNGFSFSDITTNSKKFLASSKDLRLLPESRSSADNIVKLSNSALQYLEYEKFLTDLWKKRGIIWDD